MAIDCRVATTQQLPNGLAAVLFAELVHSASGIHHLLLAGIERMTRGAYLDVHLILAQCGSGDNFVAATAYDFDFLVLRMSIRFHD
ncbi:hypothetical protein A3194_02050 [Candidatus Thiodiazotropha endoloripes]|nr:hypothetical protein A3194_02050 [Candidatus Thiodiazotropha endoloripes]